MTNLNPILLKCFDLLTQRLFIIESSDFLADLQNPGNPIDSLVERGIFGIDPEDAQDCINIYLKRITELSDKIDMIVLKFEFTETHEPTGDGTFSNYVRITPEQQQINLRNSLEKELSGYTNSLELLNSKLQNTIEELGSGPLAKAGFKLTFNLTVPEIGSLFNLLYDSEIIQANRKNGPKLTKVELARFICANFSSKAKPDIQLSSMQNNLVNTNPNSEQKIAEELQRILNIIDPKRG